MDIKQKAKEELETRLKKVEDFIADRGVGSAYLHKAKRMQRNVNIAIVAGSLITIAGIVIWAASRGEEEE